MNSISITKKEARLRYLPNKNAIIVYALLILVYAVAFAIILPVRKGLPDPLPETEDIGFSATRAWKQLQQFATEPHPYNSETNLKTQEYLSSVLQELSDRGKALNRTVDLVLKDNVTYTGFSLGGGTYSGWRYFESSNLLLRVEGTKKRPEALLISAHFDSVPFSHGATDNGVGVVVALEVARSLIEQPIADTVIFNLNNCEEMGLLGSESFMKHPWSKDVRAFINLEGAGAGGRSMVFRSSDEPLNHFYSHSPFPHTSVIANDVFKLGLIKSSTDYQVYAYKYNISGLDIAFYQRRSHYHTLLDSIDSTSPRSVQHMGGVTLATTRALANSEYLYRGLDYRAKPAIHYDILGKSTVIYNFKWHVGVNVALLVIIPIFYIVGYYLMKRNRVEKSQRLTLGGFLLPLLRSFLAITLTIIFGILFNILFGFYLSKANGNVVYGRPVLVMFAFASTTVWAFTMAQWLWRWLENRHIGKTFILDSHINRDRLAFHGMMLVWWCTTLISVIASAYGLGLLYYALWLTIAHLVGVFILEGIEFRWGSWSKSNITYKWVWPIRMVISCLPPLFLIIDIVNILVDATSQTVADGTPSFMVYALFSIAFTTCLICLIPWLQKGDAFPSLVCLLTLWVVIMVILTGVLFPYNAGAPIRVFHNVYHEPGTGNTWTVTRSVCDLPKLLSSIESTNSNRKCTVEAGIHECTWNSTSKPIFTKVNAEQSPIITQVKTNTPEGQRELEITISAPETRTCSFQFQYDTTEEYSVNGDVIKEKLAENRMFIFKREFEKNIVFLIRNAKPEKRSVSIFCYYDNYKKHFPSFDSFKDSLPDWAIISLRGYGAVTVMTSIDV
ncbi:hypothetical protein K7432_008131 [Basidiobolus ranarum]|uniref:Peptide hydrolase n=1 Tax=Basidiobolus ranarum TaxID=34480 RepID=A0ABR2WSK1_9FUNG